MRFRGLVASSVIIAVGLMASAAGAVTITTNYAPSAAGTPILIGGSSTPQYSFFSGAYLGFIQDSDFIVGNGGSTIAFPDNGVPQMQLGQVATKLGAITFTDGNYQLDFNIGQTAYTGLATVTGGGTLISSISYNPLASTVSAAPEPGTWALMLGGIGVIGAALRLGVARRRENEAWNTAA